MSHLLKHTLLLLLIGLPFILFAQINESEPNNSRESANALSLYDTTLINAVFSPAGDTDYFVLTWQNDAMYYLTSIENEAGVAPNLALYFENAPDNILTTNVGGRNGNGNFRLSGYVPAFSGHYYAKIFDTNNAEGGYKICLAGGRKRSELLVHEPDNTILFSSATETLAKNDTVYGALYPENDIDYYKIRGTAGERYEIFTCPVLDLDVRDTDTYLMLFDSLGTLLLENDDVGTVQTSSGPVNSTFSRMTSIFPATGTYYLAVRSYYNTNFEQTISETNPPMGEYGLYYSAELIENVFLRFPHIELPTTESVLIQWQTTTVQPTRLKWGTTPDCDNLLTIAEPVQDHLVKLTGLSSAAKYYYRAFASDGDSTETLFFSTAKPATVKKVSFFVISDSSPYEGFGSTPAQLAVAGQIQRVDYDFGLHAGDVNQHHGEEYDLVFFEPYRDILAHAPIFTCVGNHDTYYDNTLTYQKSFNLPHNNPDSTERYYSFNYGFAHFISLDTNLPYYPGSAEYEWFEEDLNSDMRKETFWTFVYFHHPPWSEGWEGYPGEIPVRQNLVPLFETYNVDMVFNGHTHDYERGYLNGVYYIITGGGGAPLENGVHAYDYEHVSVWINQHQFTYIQLDDKTLTLQAINKDGELIDTFSFDKSTTAIDMDTGLRPGEFSLYQNHPNPFNGSTTITFDLKRETDVRLKFYDLNGRVIRRLVSNRLAAGRHQITWNGKTDAGYEAASGVYIYLIETPEFTESRKALLIK